MRNLRPVRRTRGRAAALSCSALLLTFLLDHSSPILRRRLSAHRQRRRRAGSSARVLVLLLPQALAISIPMAVLLGLLIAFGRLSADREFVAMQACGVSIYQLLRPFVLVAVAGARPAPPTIMIVARPDANQAFRELVFKEVASRVENKIQPRVLFDRVPEPRALRARRRTPTTSCTTSSSPTPRSPGRRRSASRARDVSSSTAPIRVVQLQLADGTQHTMLAAKPDDHQANSVRAVQR